MSGNNLRTANGDFLGGEQQAKVRTVTTIDSKNLSCLLDVVVVEGLPVEMLIGIDLLARLGAVIDCAKRRVMLMKGRNNTVENDGSCINLISTVIPPRSSALVELTLEGAPNEECVITASNRDDELLIPTSLNQIQNGNVVSVVTNPTNAPVVLEGRSQIGNWVLADRAP